MEWIAAAIVFVALLYFFPRAVGVTLAAAVILGILVGAYWWWQNNLEEAEAAKVLPTYQVDAGTTRCKPDYPVFLGYLNNSNRTVKSIYFSVLIRRKGYSGSIGSISGLTQDKILLPGEGFGLCYAMPQLSVPTSAGEIELEPSYKIVSWQ